MLQKIKCFYYKTKTKLYFKIFPVKSNSNFYIRSLFILSFLNLDQYVLTENVTLTGMQKMLVGLLGIFILELWCFINVIGYIFTVYIINSTDIEKKYPKFQKIFTYYKKMNKYFIIFEVLFFILLNITLIILFSHLLYLTQQ